MDNAMVFVVPLVVALFGFVVFFLVAGKIGSINGREGKQSGQSDWPPR